MAYTTINKSSSFMNPKIYTGNGSAKTISGVGFQPDLLWTKCRSNTYSHIWVDSVRGITKQISSNTNAVEATNAQGVTAFNSDGYVLGTQNEFANNGNTFVGWSWKAGTAVSGNTSGSGTYKSYTGSVNATAGFSIIKYTGNGTNGMTIPHHLGAVPKLIIVKRLDGSGNWNWQVYHTSLGATKYIGLNDTTGAGTSSSRWYDVEPTSSVFTLGNDSDVNVNDATFVAYSFSEIPGHSKFGSYIGNGDANGTFVYTGFKPAFVMVKQTNASGEDWFICDNKREGYNTENNRLLPNLSSAESTDSPIDLLSNGFKARLSGANVNGSGASYIFMAFGQTLVGTNNIPNNAR